MLDNLKRLLPLPVSVKESPNESDWDKIENKLNLKLPQDFKGFITNYGTGSVADEHFFFNPVSSNENLNLFAQISEITQSDLYTKQETPESMPF
jgi:SMI1-KNR4 cell-wall